MITVKRFEQPDSAKVEILWRQAMTIADLIKILEKEKIFQPNDLVIMNKENVLWKNFSITKIPDNAEIKLIRPIAGG